MVDPKIIESAIHCYEHIFAPITPSQKLAYSQALQLRANPNAVIEGRNVLLHVARRTVTSRTPCFAQRKALQHQTARKLGLKLPPKMNKFIRKTITKEFMYAEKVKI